MKLGDFKDICYSGLRGICRVYVSSGRIAGEGNREFEIYGVRIERLEEDWIRRGKEECD